LLGNTWIGGSDATVEGVWRWADGNAQFWQGAASGSSVGGSYTKWQFGQPNNSFNQDCLIFWGGLGSGTWSDEGCGTLANFVCEGDLCPLDANKTEPGQCGCGVADSDTDGDGTLDCQELCPLDPDRTAPGTCGCAGATGNAAAGTPCSDGLCSANDECDGAGHCGSASECIPGAGCVLAKYDNHAYTFCPTDSTWQAARTTCQSVAGMDLVHIDDAVEDAFIDSRLSAPAWIGASDRSVEGTWTWADDGVQFWSGACLGTAVGGRYANWYLFQPDNLFDQDCAIHKKQVNAWSDQACGESYDFVCEVTDACPLDPSKRWAGLCGCGVADVDTDRDGALDCQEACPLDPKKQQAGVCGCGNPDVDSDGDGVLDCEEQCPEDALKLEPQTCGCGKPETDSDFDGQPNCLPCPGTQLGAAWPMSGACRGGAHRSTFIGAQTTTQNWSSALTLSATSAPTLGASGLVYVGANDGLHALSVSGAALWTASTPAPVRTSPAIDWAGRLFFGADDGTVRALLANTGAALWTLQTGSPVRASPTLTVNGFVIVANDAGLVLALDPADGHVLWSYQTGAAVVAAPTVAADGRVLVSCTDHFVYALRPETGLSLQERLLWATDLGAAVRTSATLAVGQAAAYVGTNAGRLVKLRILDGAVVWEFSTGGTIVSSAALGALQLVYFASTDGNVYALQDQGAEPAELWRFSTGAAVSADVTVGADGTLYVGSDKLYALRPLPNAVSRILWQLSVPGGVRTAASITSSGALIVASASTLYSIGASTPSGCAAGQVCASYLGVNYCGARIPGMRFSLPPDCPPSGLCPNSEPCTELLGYRFCYTPCALPAAAP
jgi:outer membrane protein assembly factor BamB